ncbi:MAG: hypothetical protein ACKOEM_14460 [Planctomycetia bacterium]
MSLRLSLGCLAALVFAMAAAAAETVPLDIGSRRELFVDDSVIDRLTGVTRRLQSPVAREIALTHDAPWEGGGCGYHSVFRDGEKYRLYYRGSRINVTAKPTGVACYAESDDGVRWRKPNLGLVEFGGSRENNIVFASGPYPGLPDQLDAGHIAFFHDTNPNVPAEARYKALVGADGMRALYAFASADGIQWKPLRTEPILRSGADPNEYFDSQNTAIWDARDNCYRAYCRTWTGGLRGIRTATSTDFLTWGEFTTVEFQPGAPSEQLYTNAIAPYARAPHLLLGFPARYVDRGWTESVRQLPDLAGRQQREKLGHPRFATAVTDAQLMSSRDGRKFHRWPEAFLRPGLERPGTWNYGHQYLAWGLVETASELDPGIPELSLYAVEKYWDSHAAALRRYTVRADGFVALHADAAGGEAVTKPLTFAGGELALNFSSSAAGGIRVELQDADGKPLPGFSLGDCDELYGDALDRRVSWRGKRDVGALAGDTIRLRFTLKDADLYAFRFVADERQQSAKP